MVGGNLLLGINCDLEQTVVEGKLLLGINYGWG